MKNVIQNTITNIYKVNFKIKKSESVIVFTDRYSNELTKTAKLITKEGKNFTKRVAFLKYQVTGSHGAEPPEALWLKAFSRNVVKELKAKKIFKPLRDKKINKASLKEAEKIIKKFKKDSVNIVVALSHYSTTHTNFRRFLTEICKARYASMPLFEKRMLKGAMNVDWGKMAERTEKIAQTINKADRVKIRTPNGTHISFSKRGRKAKADTGIITQKGAYSNLPAGEVYFAPVEGTANGKLILEWAPTQKLKSAITITVKNGIAVDVKGKEEYAGFLRKKFSERPENANIAELGIGTNDKASRPDSILETEKILGTIHIAFGDNSSFGGKVSTPFHQDYIFFKPTVWMIYKNGKKRMLINKGRIKEA
ncbi:MAG: aminopeptidase [Nitrospirae bacterium]|nr:aminopeptidase [Nitrospirota bacterium]